MHKYGQVEESIRGIEKKDPADYTALLKPKDQLALRQLFQLHNGKNGTDLIRHTYTRYPYYAIHTRIAAQPA